MPTTFDDVRELGAQLPDVEASRAWGTAALKLRKKLMACTAIHKSAEPSSLMVRLGFDDRDALIERRPDVFYVTPHYSPYPCVVVRLDKIERPELRRVLDAGWRFMMEHAPVARVRKKAAKKPTAKAARGATVAKPGKARPKTSGAQRGGRKR